MSTRVWKSGWARVDSMRLLACAVTAVMALLTASAGVAAHGPDPIFSGRWNQNQSLLFGWRAGSVPATRYQTAIRAAAADASAADASTAGAVGPEASVEPVTSAPTTSAPTTSAPTEE